MLADHLDASLALGEDLLALVLPPRIDLDEANPASSPEAVEQFVRAVSRLEKLMIMRVLQARRRLPEVDLGDRLIASTGTLFRAQTDMLLDLIEVVGVRQQESRFDGGADAFAYLRSRGLLSPEAAAPSPFESVEVTEAFRIGGAIPLGPLMDMVARMLDLLDTRYGLYLQLPEEGEDANTERPAPSTVRMPIEDGERGDDARAAVAFASPVVAEGAAAIDGPAASLADECPLSVAVAAARAAVASGEEAAGGSAATEAAGDKEAVTESAPPEQGTTTLALETSKEIERAAQYCAQSALDGLRAVKPPIPAKPKIIVKAAKRESAGMPPAHRSLLTSIAEIEDRP